MSGNTEWLFEDHTAVWVVLASICKTRAETATEDCLGFLPSSMNSFLLKKKKKIYYSILLCVLCMGLGSACECKFPGGQKKVRTPGAGRW